MKIDELTLLFVIAHLLGDFYFQSQQLACQKDRHIKGVLTHSCLYAATIVTLGIGLVLLGSHWHLLLAGTLISILHMIIDIIKFLLQVKFAARLTPGSKGSAVMYLTDQALHIAVIVFIIQGCYLSWYSLPLPVFITREALKWTLLILLNAKPANISFKKLFEKYVPDISGPEELCLAQSRHAAPQPGAGALIGTIERFLCIIFISLGQFAAIGLIYTAKSIARFEKIGKNPRFAEYYLIGTLYSILFVLICYYSIMKLL
ncbi:MAG: DUF3307 domain-containing protein [Clostridiales bacterium]|nr:DUF3307 domain-containing protein [Clostridiales bacterium]